MTADIRTTASRIVYENRWMKVREDRIVRRDGSDGHLRRCRESRISR